MSLIISAASDHDGCVVKVVASTSPPERKRPSSALLLCVSRVQVLHQHVQDKSLFSLRPLRFHHLKTRQVVYQGRGWQSQHGLQKAILPSVFPSSIYHFFTFH